MKERVRQLLYIVVFNDLYISHLDVGFYLFHNLGNKYKPASYRSWIQIFYKSMFNVFSISQSTILIKHLHHPRKANFNFMHILFILPLCMWLCYDPRLYNGYTHVSSLESSSTKRKLCKTFILFK